MESGMGREMGGDTETETGREMGREMESSAQSRLYIVCTKTHVKSVKTWLETQDALWKGEKIVGYIAGGDQEGGGIACEFYVFVFIRLMF